MLPLLKSLQGIGKNGEAFSIICIGANAQSDLDAAVEVMTLLGMILSMPRLIDHHMTSAMGYPSLLSAPYRRPDRVHQTHLLRVNTSPHHALIKLETISSI